MPAELQPGNFQLLSSRWLWLCSALQSLWLCLLPKSFSPQLEGKVIDKWFVTAVFSFGSLQYTVSITYNPMFRDTGIHWPTVVFVPISSSRASQDVDFSARTILCSASLTFRSASCSLASLSLSKPPSRCLHWPRMGKNTLSKQSLSNYHKHIIAQ